MGRSWHLHVGILPAGSSPALRLAIFGVALIEHAELQQTTIASVEAQFADLDPPADLPFQDLGIPNPVADWCE